MDESSDESKKEISDFVNGISKEKDKIELDGAVEFNSFELKDQQAILQIYQTKAAQGELKSPPEDKIACIEEVARLYHAQKCAFEDVLAEKNFDPTQEVLKTYGGRIAILTNNGTIIILGKYKEKGRLVTMDRIHSPELSYDHKRGYLVGDLKLNESPYIRVPSDGTGYKHSPARALAINPHGSDDDDELEEKNINDTIYGIGMKTMMFLLQPREEVKSK